MSPVRTVLASVGWPKAIAATWVVVVLVQLALAAAPVTSEAKLIASTEPDWPQFRGPRRDGISDERGLLQSWPEGGPKPLWSTKGAGRGFSSPIIVGDRLYLTGDFGEESRVLAFDLTGKLIWSTRNGDAWLNQYQGARAAVTFSAGRIYHENAHGRLACMAADTGKEIWAVNLLERFGGENITWGLSECVVVDERAVFATVGGRGGLIVALDKRNGEVLWRSSSLMNPEKTAPETPGYAAPILIRFAGRRLLIGCSSRHLFCIDADSGELQWTKPWPTSYSVLAMSPVLVGQSIFMTAPFGPPGTLFHLKAPSSSGEKINVQDGWTTPLDTAHGGVVHIGTRLFGTFYPRQGGWAALDATTGKLLYQAADMVKGAALHADGRLYALCEDGWMLLLNPTETEFEVKGRFRLATARDRDAWAHPVIVDGRMYLRYHDAVHCYDIRAGTKR